MNRKVAVTFFFQKPWRTKLMRKILHGFSAQRDKYFFPLKHLSQRRDYFTCRGSTKYFVLMLDRLFSAELDERRWGGNVYLIYC